jgi:predicted small secreted protein
MRLLALLLALATFLSACETMKGVGRDLENAGEALDDALD